MRSVDALAKISTKMVRSESVSYKINTPTIACLYIIASFDDVRILLKYFKIFFRDAGIAMTDCEKYRLLLIAALFCFRHSTNIQKALAQA